MEDQATLGSEQLLPYERGAASPADPGGSFEDVASAILGETPTTEDEQEQAPTDEVDTEEEQEASEDESDEDVPDDSEVEEPETPPTYRVRVDGQELEVPLTELIAGYSRQADYTRKTTEVANQRKALEADAVAYRQARDQYATLLPALEKALAETMPAEPDEALRQSNPGEYAARKQELRDHKDRIAAVRAEQDEIRAKQEGEFHQRIAAIRQQEAAKLLDAIPEWRDEAKSAPEKAKLVEYAASLGMDADYLDAVTDHRFVVLLRKARLYDEMQTKGRAAIQGKAAAAQVLKPGGRVQNAPNKAKRTEVQRLSERLEKSGRVDDAAALFERALDL